MNNERVRHIMVQSLASSDLNSSSSFEDFLGTNPIKILRTTADQFACTSLANRMVNASLSVLSALVFHPNISLGQVDLSDVLPQQYLPSFVSRRETESPSATDVGTRRVDYVLVSLARYSVESVRPLSLNQ